MTYKNITIIPLLLVYSFFLISMDEYKENYSNTCKKIIQKHKNQIAHYETTIRNKNLEKESERVLNKITNYKSKIIQKNEKALNSIKTNHSIPDINWNTFLRIVNDITEIHNNLKDFSFCSLYNNKNIPQNILIFLYNLLLNNDIQPQQVIISSEPNENDMYTITPSAPAIEIYKEISQDQNYYKYVLPKKNISLFHITINFETLLNLHPYSQAALCMRIIKDITLHYCIKCNILCLLESFLTCKEGTIINSHHYKNFENSCRNLSIFLPSLTDPNKAICMLAMATQWIDPNFTIDDYKLLSKINKYWQIYQLIEKNKQPSVLSAVII